MRFISHPAVIASAIMSGDRWAIQATPQQFPTAGWLLIDDLLGRPAFSVQSSLSGGKTKTL